jgi:hypothetical protein
VLLIINFNINIIVYMMLINNVNNQWEFFTKVRVYVTRKPRNAENACKFSVKSELNFQILNEFQSSEVQFWSVWTFHQATPAT